MNEIENNYRLSEEERKQLIAEIMPFLENKSKEEIELAFQLIALNGTNLLLNLSKSSRC